MQLDQLSGTNIYLDSTVLAENAVWGYIPRANSGLPGSMDLADTWNKANGFYVFFPAWNRLSGWKNFVNQLSNTMKGGDGNRRFGFFDVNGNGLGFLSVSGSGNEQALTVGNSFTFRNIVLKISPIQTKVSATFDNATSTFKIAKLSSGSIDSVMWTAAPGGGGARNIIPLGGLKIPVSGPTPGTLVTELALSLDDQSAFETGPMYFGPANNGGGLTALRYPNFIASGTSDKVSITTYIDPALPVDPKRTYFNLTDKELKTTFSSSIGRQIILSPRDGTSDPDGISARFIFSDRPVNQIGDKAAYYLTPYGSFTVGMTGTTNEGELICAYSATETFAFSRGDILRFVPGNAAYRANTPATTEDGPLYLTTSATTSWIGLTSSTANQNIYYSQPQGSPIYEDNGETGNGANYKAYQLAFKKIPAWPAQGSTFTDKDAPTPTPLVPMVPYGGLPTSDVAVVNNYQVMESKGINPQRRLTLKSVSETKSSAPLFDSRRLTTTDSLIDNMTPLGLIGSFDSNNVWLKTKFAISGSKKDRSLQFRDMGDTLRAALYQNQIFLVIDQDTSNAQKLFTFGDADATVELASWFFDLQLQGKNPDGVPPILLLKFFRDKSIKELVDDQSLWEDAKTFSSDPSERQTQLQKIIEDAEKAVEADPNSVYANFVSMVNDPAFTGFIAVNTALKLDELPSVIKALLGGMTKEDGTSNIAAFRAHHVGVKISDTSNSSVVSLDSSSIFALVDYEDTSTSNTSLSVRTVEPLESEIPGIYGDTTGLDYYGFKVIYLRALFENNALTSFAAEVDLKVNNLFAVGVNLGNNTGSNTEEDDNIIKITGSYSEHDGTQTYSFIAEKTYEFTYDDNTYLKKITFDKVQFSATEENEGNETTSKISSRFAIWGSMEFNKLEFLDMFSFKKLSFADLGIEMSYNLTVYGGGKDPETSDLKLWFSPGNLRFDFGDTEQRTDDDSLLALLPFKLKSFLYSEKGQSISELDYFEISLETLGITPASQPPASSTFNFGLIFDLDLGSLGALVGNLSAFKFSIFLGWQPPTGGKPNALVFGVQMPEADGKLELNIQGVLKISIEQFQLKWTNDTADKLLVVALYNSYMEILGTRMPPGNIFFDFALFAPTKGENKIGWIAAFNKQAEEEKKALGVSMDGPLQAVRQLKLAENGDEGSKVFDLEYLGVGQRVGPEKNLTNFDDFLEYVRTDFWTAVNSGKYGEVYKPEGGWMVVANFVLLDIVGLGFVFYDSTPFYSLKIYITKDALKGLSFEITYTKVNDNVGLFFINFTLPDSLRTFQAGAASITLPALQISIYTNSDFKIDLGFPANDDWTVCFRVEAFVGPVPVTGSGGFYIAKLSSATDDTFKNKYDTILAAGFGARLGVGKDFTAGPFKAGVSLTFFGIIEGKIGYYAHKETEDVVKWLTDPQALSLKGQFGIIGELYGTLDFVIIKASINVRIQASVGLQLILENGIGGDILLYVEASVSVSVSVKINLGFFSISISFSFRASFRFEWKLLNSNNANSVEKLLYSAEWAALETASWNPDYPLQTGLTKDLKTWMTPEITSVWSNPTAKGVPWFVVSLTMEYLNDPSSVTDPKQFNYFENLSAQIVAWSLNTSLGLASWNDTIGLDKIEALNQDPDKLVGGLDYTNLIAGLGKMFTLAVDSIPADNGTLSSDEKEVKYATIFPMLPFLGLKTSGRGSAELNYVFEDKSNVSELWTQNDLQEYFAQLYTNITSGNGKQNLLEGDTATVPLIQTLFLDWFNALIRSTVNALLTQMQNDETTTGKLKDIYIAAVKSGQIKNVAGQMSQFFRSGLRLPATTGMELPAGSLQQTNPLYALIWQEFPVGSFTDGKQYVINLVEDASQKWVNVNAEWTLLSSDVTPYEIVGTTVSLPGTPVQTPVLQTGPQAFSLANPITWTPSGGKATTLRPLSKAMSDALKTNSPLTVKLLSRETTKAYDFDTKPVSPTDVRWALAVEMVIRKVPLGAGEFLPDTYALGSADLTVQNAMRDLLKEFSNNSSPVKKIDLLYQESSDTSGLISFPISTTPAVGQLFVLRTNTTTQSVPPPSLLEMDVDAPTTQVGADTSEPLGFLQILEQSSVTNQTGYFLTYENADGKSLPGDLFGNQTFAPVTFLFELSVPIASDQYSLPRYVNAVVLDNTVEGQLYYAETTNVEDETSYVSLAAGSTGIELSRKEPGETSVTDKLAQLYSLVAYQVPSSTGFSASNLSVPSGPQKQEENDTIQQWRLSVPLYKLATENQGKTELNRYASIGDNYSVETLVVDAFGNAFGDVQTTISNQPNLYFDDLIPMGNWTGVRSVFNFQSWSSPTNNTVCSSLNNQSAGGKPQVDKFSIYLCPSKDALPAPESDSAMATTELYQTIINQLVPDDVLMFVTTNLDSTKSDISLSAEQKKAVLDMLTSVKNYLVGGADTLASVTLTVTVPGKSDDLALVFELQANFGTKRTKNVSPEVTDYPNAFRVTTNVPPQSASDNLADFANDFSTAFPAFALATGPADGNDISVGLPALADEVNETISGGQPKGLWAVSKKVTDLTLSNTIRYYLAPKPLDTRLRSGTVSMPNNLNALSSLPNERTFNDVDLDDIARTAFAAIDTALGAENASNMFQQSRASYSQVAYARENIADYYSDKEVEWLLQDETFKGDSSDLCQGQDQMAQQMRAALGSAYAVNSIVQTKATFNQALPSSIGNRLQLFGQMQRPTDENAAENSGGFGLGTARVDVPSGNGGQTATMTFLYGVTDQKIEDNRYQEFPLEWAVSHIQVFLEDRVINYCEHGETAPPSIWLQLINSFASPPTMGETIIPLALREYPTPPTMVVQTAKRDTENTGTTLADQTRWVYTSTYQARLFAADEITLNLIYNTGGSETTVEGADDVNNAEKTYTLFEALTRFQSGYEILQPQMSPITKDTPPDVITAFATLVTQLAQNSDWSPLPSSENLSTGNVPIFTLEQDVVTDRTVNNSDARLITLTPDPLVVESNPWIGDKCITALDPVTMKPYTGETESCSTTGEKIVTHNYTPVPPLTSNFVTHQVKVKGLTTLLYENGNSGIGTRRNASLYPKDDVFSNPEFIYQTPIVALTNPLTPFVDNPKPVNIYPTVVSSENLDLGEYVRLTLEAMMGLTEVNTELLAQDKETPAPENRRLKIDARYGFPIGSPSGSSDDAEYFLPLSPAVLVRSFDLPVDGLQNALKEWVGQSGDPAKDGVKPYAAVLAGWLQNSSLPLGQPTSPDAPPKGAILVLDVTLYSQLTSGVNQLPLLRLSDLRLALSVVAPPVVSA